MKIIIEMTIFTEHVFNLDILKKRLTSRDLRDRGEPPIFSK